MVSSKKMKVAAMLNKFIHILLWNFTELFPGRVRDIRVDGELYLRRYYLTPQRRDSNGKLTDRFQGFGIYLHYFYRGDEDRELHNHPWESARSLILAGGYQEERRNNKTNKIELVNVRPLTINKINHNDFHRIVTKSDDSHVWTLFFAGKRIQSWGFWDRETNGFVPFENFLESKSSL